VGARVCPAPGAVAGRAAQNLGAVAVARDGVGAAEGEDRSVGADDRRVWGDALCRLRSLARVLSLECKLRIASERRGGFATPSGWVDGDPELRAES